MAHPSPDPEGSPERPLRVIRPRRAPPSEAARLTRAEIDLAAVRHNHHELAAILRTDAEAAGRAPTELWGVLKADAYGHGATQIGVTLERAGVAGLCVALLEEGLELRGAGVSVPILVMGGYWGRRRDSVEALIEANLTPVVYDEAQLTGLASALAYVRGVRATYPVHLKLDTGMGRLGVRPEGLGGMIQALRQHPAIVVEALMTHLACADDDDLADTREQLALFDRLTADLAAAGHPVKRRHAANSAAMLRLPEAQHELVRIGVALYGVHPCPTAPMAGRPQPRLRPAMKVVTEVVALRDLEPDERIGYGHTWRAPRRSRIATLAMGYADGLDRALSNRGHVLIQGARAPIVGTVSMDLTMVDVTDLPGVAVRDEVVVLGNQSGRFGRDAITADEIAALTGTISWECLTSISRRVPRFYRHP
ncbi:MAG: alanine racemase [Myxococcales bacterium]|nr:alanine racemase [Myxococcales bacterium]